MMSNRRKAALRDASSTNTECDFCQLPLTVAPRMFGCSTYTVKCAVVDGTTMIWCPEQPVDAIDAWMTDARTGQETGLLANLVVPPPGAKAEQEHTEVMPGEWAACPACAPLVSAHDWDKLGERADHGAPNPGIVPLFKLFGYFSWNRCEFCGCPEADAKAPPRMFSCKPFRWQYAEYRGHTFAWCPDMPPDHVASVQGIALAPGLGPPVTEARQADVVTSHSAWPACVRCATSVEAYDWVSLWCRIATLTGRRPDEPDLPTISRWLAFAYFAEGQQPTGA